MNARSGRKPRSFAAKRTRSRNSLLGKNGFRSLRSKLRYIRSFVVTRVQDLRAVLNSDVGHVRAELAKHIDQITLTPTGDAHVGTWNFVGCGSIDGAGGGIGPNVCRYTSSGRPPHDLGSLVQGLAIKEGDGLVEQVNIMEEAVLASCRVLPNMNAKTPRTLFW